MASMYNREQLVCPQIAGLFSIALCSDNIFAFVAGIVEQLGFCTAF